MATIDDDRVDLLLLADFAHIVLTTSDLMWHLLRAHCKLAVVQGLKRLPLLCLRLRLTYLLILNLGLKPLNFSKLIYDQVLTVFGFFFVTHDLPY